MKRKNAVERYAKSMVPLLTILVTFVGVPSSGLATPPLEPLTAPKYSFDLASPKVQNGTITAQGVLRLGASGVQTDVPGLAFGLASDADELDALSGANATIDQSKTITLLFSVDTHSVGAETPAPELVDMDVPYNAFDQVLRGHAAGDEFMSTALFVLPEFTIIEPTTIDLNNLLVRNNFDEGGTDFAASPDTGAHDVVVDVLQDRVDAMAVVDTETEAIYFSASRDSPSLPGLQGQVTPSGANVYVHQPEILESADSVCPAFDDDDWRDLSGLSSCERTCCITARTSYDKCLLQTDDLITCGAVLEDTWRTCLDEACAGLSASSTNLYASFLELGLQQDDDIDALIVIDANVDGLFNADDRVAFSLTPDSPSLSVLPGASEIGAAADVFVVWAAQGGVEVLATAAQLGLGHADDNIDALDAALCNDTELCAALHGIRMALPIPVISDWGMVLLLLLILNAGTIVVYRRCQRPCAL